MITPLMLILSGLNEKLQYDHAVDTMYLNREDRGAILSEVRRLGALAFDEAFILTTQDARGKEVCDTYAVINSSVELISRPTAILVTRIRECYRMFSASEQSSEDSGDGLDTDTVIPHLEGNPNFIYVYVYDLMRSSTMDYKTKIATLSDLLTAIRGGASSSYGDTKMSFLLERLTLHSTASYWERLIINDWIKQTGTNPGRLAPGTLDIVKQELCSMGFYGFLNPLKMYSDFASSRINRKVEANISAEVVYFLDKVVRSGGGIVL